MEWESKVWGRTRCLVDSDKFARHELELIENTFCSFHYHTNRANKFKLKSGIVAVMIVHGWQIEQFILGINGNECVVPSLVPHQFQVIQSGAMIEEYWPDRGGEVWNGDIIRLSQGGKSSTPIKGLHGILSVGDCLQIWKPGGPE